jgi:hypothetical protein
MKSEFYRKIFELITNTKFNQNPPVGAEISDTARQTDGYEEANIRFSQFFEGAYKYNVKYVTQTL